MNYIYMICANKNTNTLYIKTALINVEDKYPKILVAGALGRVGTGAIDFCESLGLRVTRWDI